MKQAEIREEEKDREEKEMKLKDLSEWKTKSADQLKSKLQKMSRPAVVGYQTLHLIRNGEVPIVGRRSFGETVKSEVKTLETPEEDSSDLDSLWKKDQKPKSKSKRPLTDESPMKNTKKRKSHP
jgi:hypothetical protein